MLHGARRVSTTVSSPPPHSPSCYRPVHEPLQQGEDVRRLGLVAQQVQQALERHGAGQLGIVRRNEQVGRASVY